MGVGSQRVARMIAVIEVSCRFKSGAELAAYVGEIARILHSGKRIPRRARLCTMGDAQLRIRLWMPVLCSVVPPDDSEPCCEGRPDAPSRPSRPPPKSRAERSGAVPRERLGPSPRATMVSRAERGVVVGVVEGEVQAAALLAAARALDDQVRDQREVAQLEQVAGDREVPVVLADLLAEELDAAARRARGACRCARCRRSSTSGGGSRPSCALTTTASSDEPASPASQGATLRRARRLGASRTSSAARAANTSPRAASSRRAGWRRAARSRDLADRVQVAARRCGRRSSVDDAAAACSAPRARPGSAASRMSMPSSQAARVDVREALDAGSRRSRWVMSRST